MVRPEHWQLPVEQPLAVNRHSIVVSYKHLVTVVIVEAASVDQNLRHLAGINHRSVSGWWLRFWRGGVG